MTVDPGRVLQSISRLTKKAKGIMTRRKKIVEKTPSNHCCQWSKPESCPSAGIKRDLSLSLSFFFL